MKLLTISLRDQMLRNGRLRAAFTEEGKAEPGKNASLGEIGCPLPIQIFLRLKRFLR